MNKADLLALIKGDRDVADAIRELIAEREQEIVDAAVKEVERRLSGAWRYRLGLDRSDRSRGEVSG